MQLLLPVILLVTGLLTSCATIQEEEMEAVPDHPVSLEERAANESIDEAPAEAKEGLKALLDPAEEGVNDEFIDFVTELRSNRENKKTPPKSVPSPSSSEMDLSQNEHVKKWIQYFMLEDRERFQRFLDRGHPYRAHIERILLNHGLPKELYFLPLIESGYVTHARSHAAAVGIWQFIPGTGRNYGLASNYQIEERRDPIRSTESAAKYLKDLYNAFQNWELALSAYNCGEYRVLRAIMEGNTRDFWKLKKDRRLPRETRNYVPKFIAATLMGSQPGKFGFVSPKEKGIASLPQVEGFAAPTRVRLSSVSKVTGLPLKTLQTLNPHLKNRITPSLKRKSHYIVWVPEGSVHSVEKKFAALKRYQQRAPRTYASSGNYKVKRGDTLGRIARRHGTSVSKLKRMNRLKGNRIFVGQRLKVSASSATRVSKASGGLHKVRRGESLYLIAKKHGVSPRDLKTWNGLKSATIHPGQKIKLGPKVAKYRVRRGDTLSRIAEKFSTSVRSIKRKNRLKSTTIRVGQLLKI